jgi:hypothetical protein
VLLSRELRGASVELSAARRKVTVMRNRVVVHFQGGRILKGTSHDFAPARDSFHLTEEEGGQVLEVVVERLKAVFFVRSFEGDAARNDDPAAKRSGFGKRIRVRFRDGEEIIGYTSGFTANRPAFFLFPADEESNNEKVFVVVSATTAIDFI